MPMERVNLTLASAVASGGTFTVNYPDGTSAGMFKQGKNHEMLANGVLFKSPEDFTISFGASSATITYNGSTTLAAGLAVAVGLDMAGEDVDDAFENLAEGSVVKEVSYLVDLGSPVATDADGLFASASVAGSTAIDLITDKLDVPRVITITSAGDDSGVTFTVTSKDLYGNTISESVTGGDSVEASTAKAHYDDIVITPDGDTASTITIGWNDELGLPVWIGDASQVQAVLENGVIVGGSPVAPVRLPFVLEQVSLLAGTTAAAELISPVEGVVTKMAVVVRAAVTTGGTVTAALTTTTIDGLAVAVADAATKGTTATDTPTAGHASTLVSKDQRIQIIPSNDFDTAGAVEGYIEIRPTGIYGGTLTEGLDLNTKSTATTTDVRGLFDPDTACDGTTGFALRVTLEDPSFKGNVQYAG